MIFYSFLLALQFLVKPTLPLCGGLVIEEWNPPPSPESFEAIERACRNGMDGFPDWIRPLRRVQPKELHYRIRFLPSGDQPGELNDPKAVAERGVEAWGWCDHKEKILYITSDGPVVKTFLHELYHAESRQYGIYRLYTGPDEELMADEFADYIALF